MRRPGASPQQPLPCPVPESCREPSHADTENRLSGRKRLYPALVRVWGFSRSGLVSAVLMQLVFFPRQRTRFSIQIWLVYSAAFKSPFHKNYSRLLIPQLSLHFTQGPELPPSDLTLGRAQGLRWAERCPWLGCPGSRRGLRSGQVWQRHCSPEAPGAPWHPWGFASPADGLHLPT